MGSPQKKKKKKRERQVRGQRDEVIQVGEPQREIEAILGVGGSQLQVSKRRVMTSDVPFCKIAGQRSRTGN